MDVPGDAAPTVRVTVKTPRRQEEFAVPLDRCIREFKGEVSVRFSSPASQLVLVFAGRILRDHKTLGEYNIHDEATIYLVVHSRREFQGHLGQQRSSSQGIFKITAEGTGIPGLETGRGSAFNTQDLQGLISSFGLNTVHLPELQSQLLPSTDMAQLIENPLVDSKISSSVLIKDLFTDSPLKQITIQKIPEISHFLSTSDSLMLELARSPATVREIMRNPKDMEGCLASLLGGDSAGHPGKAEQAVLRQQTPLKQPGGQVFAAFRCCPSRVGKRGVPHVEIQEPLLKAHPVQPGSHGTGSSVQRDPAPAAGARPKDGPGVVMLMAIRRLLEQVVKQLLQDIVLSLRGRGAGRLPSRQPDPAGAKAPQRQPHVWGLEMLGAELGSRGLRALSQVLQTLQKAAADAGVTPQLVCLLEGLLSLGEAGGPPLAPAGPHGSPRPTTAVPGPHGQQHSDLN